MRSEIRYDLLALKQNGGAYAGTAQRASTWHLMRPDQMVLPFHLATNYQRIGVHFGFAGYIGHARAQWPPPELEIGIQQYSNVLYL